MLRSRKDGSGGNVRTFSKIYVSSGSSASSSLFSSSRLKLGPPDASEPGLEPKPPPEVDRRNEGFDSAGGGSRSLDALGNLLGMAAVRLGERLAVLLDESQLLLLVLRLGERLGALLDELLLCSMGEWRASPPARFFHSRLLPTSTSSPRLGGVGKPSEFHSSRSRSSPTCAQ